MMMTKKRDCWFLPISTRGELDEAEQRNIEDAIRWTIQRRKRFSVSEVLSEQFVKQLHQALRLADRGDYNSLVSFARS